MGVAQITLLTIPVSATISATVPGELVIPTQSPDSPTVLPSPIFTQSPLTATSAFTPSSTPMPSPTSTASLTPLPDHPLPQYDLAFSSNRDGKFSIYLMDSSNPKQWLALPSIGDYEYTYWPTFCGSRLAFEAIDTQSVLPRWIYFVDLVQMSIEKLELPTDLEAERLSAPGCSPKGRFIAYSVSRQLKWYLTVVDQSQGIVVFETTNRRYPQLGFPSWTADENFLYWMGALDTGYFDINESFGLLEPANAVTNVVAKGKYPAISPDGKRLAYFCGNLSFLCLFDWPSGKKLDEKLVSYYREIGGKPAPASAAWSADGKWLYFSSSAAGHWDIYRISRDGGDALNLTEFWDSDELMPATR